MFNLIPPHKIVQASDAAVKRAWVVVDDYALGVQIRDLDVESFFAVNYARNNTHKNLL